MELLLSFLIIILLILLNALFVAAEFAIIGVRPSRVEQLAQQGDRTAIGIRETVRTPGKQDRYIATAQLGITLASLGLGMYGEPVIAHLLDVPLHAWFGLEGAIVHTISFIVALTLMTYLHVVFGEMIPKSLALQNAERMALLVARPMALAQRVFWLGVVILNKIGLGVLKLLGVSPPSQTSRLHTPDELEMIVTESFAGGLLDAEEQQLVLNIFDFSERRVGQVMTPRPRIEAVPATISEEALLESFNESAHNRLPVYEESVDNIIGIVHLKDLVRQQIHGKPFDLRTLMRRAPVVPESLDVEGMLSSLKRLHQHMAIVIDEYGGTAGVVTMEDLVEEVVGEVRDEFDVEEEAPVAVLEPGHLIVQGNVLLDELKEHVEIGEQDYDVDTVGGLVMAELNRPPKDGDEVTVNNVTFHVEEVDGLAIERVSIHFNPETDLPNGTEEA